MRIGSEQAAKVDSSSLNKKTSNEAVEKGEFCHLSQVRASAPIAHSRKQPDLTAIGPQKDEGKVIGTFPGWWISDALK